MMDPDAEGSSAAAAEEDAFDSELVAELRATFAEELRELLADVPRLIADLVDPSRQDEACGELGRIFHTVKGSAATVGWDELQAIGLDLQQAFEGEDDDGPELPLAPAFFETTRAGITAIFRAADVPPPEPEWELAAEAAGTTEDPADELNDERDAAPAEPGTNPLPAEVPADEDQWAQAEGNPEGNREDSEAAAIETEMLEAFALDADAAMEASETAMLSLEERPTDPAPLRVLFRQFHTLKGAAASVGLDTIATQMHAGEQLLDEILEGGRSAEPEALFRFLLDLLDSTSGLIAAAHGRSHDHRILDDAAARAADIPPAAAGTAAEPNDSAGTGQTTKPAPDNAPPPPAASPAEPSAPPESDGIVRVHANRLDLLMSRVSELVVSRTQLDEGMAAIGELRDKLAVDRMRLGETIEGFRGFEFQQGATRAEHAGGGASATPSTPLDEFTDLEFDKYDDFNVLTRTLVELASDTSEIVEDVGRLLDSIGDESRQISKVTSSLQRTVGGMRLVSLDSLYRRIGRAVRDAARQSGKQAVFETRGGDVQLDRSLVESLYAPLLHIARNAVAHGIAKPEGRKRAGKPAAGRILIEATQRHGNVELRVRDDGEGLDYEAIRRRAIERGLLQAGAAPDDDALARFIFEPGFSTRESADGVAGRGVGMDVVTAEVAHLRGRVHIESEPGRGTEIRIVVPLSAIIDQILLLRGGDQTLALSQGPVETVLNIDAADIESASDEAGTAQLFLRQGGERIPACRLDALLGRLAAEPPATAVILRCGDERVALLVERIEAQREAVIRPLGPLFEAHPFISSATLKGDGEVVFALDATRILPTMQDAAPIAPPPEAEAAVSLPSAILWADDSISVRKLANHFLHAEGWTHETAVDGRDALDKLRQGRFRVVVTDLEMPRMHGYELLHEIRNDPQLAELPVIVCSSRTSEKHRRRAEQAGANGYLTKPFSRASVAEAIRGFLD